jgi:hypothetical protein
VHDVFVSRSRSVCCNLGTYGRDTVSDGDKDGSDLRGVSMAATAVLAVAPCCTSEKVYESGNWVDCQFQQRSVNVGVSVVIVVLGSASTPIAPPCREGQVQK